MDIPEWEGSSDKHENKVNIFDEFNTDASLETDVQKLKKEQKKDVLFYLNITSKVLQVVVFLLILTILIWYMYVYVQKNEDIESQSFLDPVCGIIDGWVPLPAGSCSSISYLKKYYKWQIQKQEEEQTKSIMKVLPNIYRKINFLNTKEMRFLLDKSKNRVDIIEVLSKFDKLKNNYLWNLDRGRIECSNLKISTETHIVEMKCSAFVQGYDLSIVGFSWDKWDKNIWGTSISLANSFLNYIQKNSVDFEIINRQKVFSSDSIVSDRWYTNKTDFDLSLQFKF